MALFSAAVFEPVLHELRPAAEKSLNLTIHSDTGGSGNLMRRMVELGRACDLMILADPGMFKRLGGGAFSWRIDFAGDEMVLGVGIRAPRPDEAERDWAGVVRDPAVSLIRADEKISPAGARTLTLWQRRESAGIPGLHDELLHKTARVVDDISALAALLKSGSADYAFMYRSSCLLHELRYIRLEPPCRLADTDTECDPEAIRYALSIPQNTAHPAAAKALLRFFLEYQRERWSVCGFIPIRPLFYGTTEEYGNFSDIADYGGAF